MPRNCSRYESREQDRKMKKAFRERENVNFKIRSTV